MLYVCKVVNDCFKNQQFLCNNEIQCSTIELEEHTECRCGCDIESANCTNNQVS